MKKILLVSFPLLLFFSCNKLASPKETTETFIKAVSTADLSTAASLASSGTKAIVDKAKKEMTPVQKPEESFAFSSLTETINDSKAEVKNNTIEVPLTKEADGWKVVVTESLLSEIQDRDEALLAAKAKWEALAKEYEARLQVLREYIQYKKSRGALSPKVSLLNDAVNSLRNEKEWTQQSLSFYAQKQQSLNEIIDDALEPSMAANTDMSLNYFLQISNASDRIKSAENDYQVAAKKAHSTLYVPLPFKTTGDTKVQSN